MSIGKHRFIFYATQAHAFVLRKVFYLPPASSFFAKPDSLTREHQQNQMLDGCKPIIITADRDMHGDNMTLTSRHEAVLQQIYDETRNSLSRYIDHRSIELEIGISGHDLRPVLEDLKDKILIMENEDGLRVTPGGLAECKARWA